MNYPVFKAIMQCPSCRAELNESPSGFICIGHCQNTYPIYFNIPILIDANNKVFCIEDFSIQKPPTIFFNEYSNPLLRFLKKLRPDITLNNVSKINYSYIHSKLQEIQHPTILIIGGSIDGKGIENLKNHLPADSILVESDVAHGKNTNIILDAHQIPFKDNSFDLVIAQAVLEHVLDPFLCVKEINRILKPGGLVYAETPFMQHVHGGKFDFHRFTDLGHRRLFRDFLEEKRGVIAGGGSMLAWSLLYFITSFAPNKKIDKALSYLGCFVFFWLKYFDYLLNKSKGSYDSACGLYFLGKKVPGYQLDDPTLLSNYRGNKS